MIPVELAKTPELSRLKREYHIAEARYWRKATLILGESGTGKSTSMRNINPEEAILIKPIGKPLPFKSKDWLAWDARAKKGTVVTTDKWDVIVAAIKRAHESLLLMTSSM